MPPDLIRLLHKMSINELLVVMSDAARVNDTEVGMAVAREIASRKPEERKLTEPPPSPPQIKINGVSPRGQEFFDKFIPLVREYGMTFASCGCCNSPRFRVDGVELTDFVIFRDSPYSNLFIRYTDPNGYVQERKL